jgi:hypothetical protein
VFLDGECDKGGCPEDIRDSQVLSLRWMRGALDGHMGWVGLNSSKAAIVFIATYSKVRYNEKINNASIQQFLAIQELLLALHGISPHLLLRLFRLGNDPSQKSIFFPACF